jgi:O-antigen/teichoic acid export membrane protein
MSVHESDEDRTAMTRSAVTATLALGAVGSVALMVLGNLIPGRLGRGLVVFGPWMLPAMVAELWRFVLFRDGRGSRAVVCDAGWLVAMVILLPVAGHVRTDWGMAAWWGLGATTAAVLGAIQVRLAPGSWARATRWWRETSWPLGRWLAGDWLVNFAGPQGALFLVAAILGASQLGGLRAVQSVFAPMTLLGPTVALPSLPVLARRFRSDPGQARTTALQLSGGVVAAAAIYTVLLGLWGGPLIRFLYGDSFQRFVVLIVPVAVGQILIGLQSGFALFLKAAKRGAVLLAVHAISSSVTLIAVWALATGNGVRGAAWGLSVGDGIEAMAYIAGAWWVVKTVRSRVRDARPMAEVLAE